MSWQCNTWRLAPHAQTHRFAPDPLGAPEAASALQLSGAEITSAAPACRADTEAAWDTREAGEKRPSNLVTMFADDVKVFVKDL